MSKIYLFLGLLSFCSMLSAQSAQLLFLNDQPTPNAENHSIEIANSDGVVLATIENIGYQTASEITTVPADEILDITYKTSGGTTFASSGNVVLDPDKLYIQVLGGGPSGGSIVNRRSAVSTSPSDGSFRFDFRNGAHDIGEIDVIVRESGEKIVDNLETFDFTNGFPQTYIYPSNQVTLDITPAENNDSGICAFIMNASDFSGANVSIFTSGSSADLKCFVLQHDGTLTELDKTDPIMSSSTTDFYANAIKTSAFPNPTHGAVKINFPSSLTEQTALIITDGLGRRIEATALAKGISQCELDFSDFPAGQYIISDTKGLIQPAKILVW